MVLATDSPAAVALTTTKPESPALNGTLRPLVVQDAVVPMAIIPVNPGERRHDAPAIGVPTVEPALTFHNWACRVTVIPGSDCAVVVEIVELMLVTVIAAGSTCTKPGWTASVPPVTVVE
jgi:hypothetical protein